MGWRRRRGYRLMRFRGLWCKGAVVFPRKPVPFVEMVRPFSMRIPPRAVPIYVFIPITIVRRVEIRVVRIVVPTDVIVDALRRLANQADVKVELAVVHQSL